MVAADLRIEDAKTLPAAAREGGVAEAGAVDDTMTTSARTIGDVILELENISLSFGGVKALTDISFDVREHEIRAIIGPNGAGKSSMLNVINGVYRPQQGTITFRGERAPRHEHARRRGGRHRAHVPEHRAVQGHERARQHHDRPQPQDEGELPRAGDLGRPRAARGARATAPRSRRSSTSSRSSTSARRRSGACPTACRSASSSRARSRPSRRCCCSTSRWPA